MIKKDELKYCCEVFKWLATSNKSCTFNIRILQMSDAFIKGETLKPYRDNSLRFMLSTGFTGQYDSSSKTSVSNSIKYCPFCGKNLYKYYKDPLYANEIEGVTFNIN